MTLASPSCRKCRREGEKLFLKGARCQSQKCALVRKNYAPGPQGTRHSKPSNFSIQMREKQKTKRLYGLRENQFYRYYQTAAKKTGVTGLVLLQLLETRLDNVVYRLGWAPSRALARQIVNHGHIEVNGKKVNIPSYQTKLGDKISVRPTAKKKKYFSEQLNLSDYKAPVWLKTDPANLSGEIAVLPTKNDLDSQINEQLIIEFYSR
jgi:small subunit ribosomal protein S4